MYSKINWGNRTKSHLYKRWTSMMQRCYNPNATGYANYGGRGVKVCEEWHEFENFRNFFEPLLCQNSQKSIDRIDVNGNYCPENVRVVSQLEQNLNKRNIRLVDVDGKKEIFCQIAKRTGLPYKTLEARFAKGERGKRLFRPVEHRHGMLPVIQMTTGGEKIAEYDSISEACRKLGLDSSNLVAHLKGRRKSCGGFLWKYNC